MEGALEMGHARALLALDAARQIEAGNRVAAKGLSVRETEALVQHLAARPGAAGARSAATATWRAWRRRCPSASAPRSRSGPGARGTGKVVVHYSSLDHLDQLLKKLR